MQHRAGVARRHVTKYLDAPWDDSGHGFERMETFREVLGDEISQDLNALAAGATPSGGRARRCTRLA